MLEFNKYSINKIEDLKDFVTVAFVIIDDIYQEITLTHIKERRNINDAILMDSEIITISIVGELLTIDSENAWFNLAKKNLLDLFSKMCYRTRFNRTKRNLYSIIDEIRKSIGSFLDIDQKL